MENKKEYLSEEQFQKNKKKIIKISLIVLIVGVLVGVALIVAGVVKAKKYDSLIPEIGITKEVDTATDGLFGNILNEVDKQKKNIESAPYYMFGTFIIIFSAILAGGIYFFAKQREITAFTTQQVMPVAQEGLEKMAPSIGKVGEEIAKGVEKAKEEKK